MRNRRLLAALLYTAALLPGRGGAAGSPAGLAAGGRAWLKGREPVPAQDFWGEPLFRLQGHALPE